MGYVFRIVIFGPPNSGKSLLLKRIYEYYKDASLHGIRHLGGGPRTGVDYCSFQIGDFRYEVYAPPALSAIRVFRNKLVKNADGIIFIIPKREDMVEKTASFILELKRLLFEKHRNRSKDFPVIYVVNLFDSSSDSIADFIQQFNLPENVIIYSFSLDSEKEVRELFAKITLLASLRRLDPKSYFIEMDRLIQESKAIFITEKPSVVKEIAVPPAEMPPIEIPPPKEPLVEAEASLPELPEPPITTVPSEGKVQRKVNLISIPEQLKSKLLQNYINEIVIVDFDRSVGHIPRGYAFGTGKVVNYISDPTCLVELSIIAKHSLGFLLRDGFTFLGLVHLKSQGFLILETTSSHMKKMINIVKSLKKILSKYDKIGDQTFVSILNSVLSS